MPSMLHEAPLELLRQNPELAAALLAGTPGVAVPQGGTATLVPGEVSASQPVELRADGTTGADAELAMMAAWTGQTDLRDPAVRAATLRAIAGLDTHRLTTYTRIVLIAAPDEQSRRALETLMATVFKNEFLDNLEATAEARGEARMILQVLESRGFTVPTKIRDQVFACTDTDQLEAWGRRAAVAKNIDEIFDAAHNRR
jgi:hypothetical protein